ncbi:Spc19 protein [Maudiozyma humilis]|uniref:DASH complex subunit SPC19 n=1 Tax=Maudiozyma humilis TaxID=51915 RepID=A0AAV5RY65_MAUHU|nr:Spc19 protein [Kazachstania humilis]
MKDPLQESLWHLQEINALLEESVEQLETESKQNNDLTDTMLRFKQVYELMPEFDIERARIDLNEELEPLIQLLKDKLKESLNRHAIDLNTLKQKYELNKLTLNNGLNSDPMSSQDIDESTDVVVMGSTTNEELEELRELKKKKEALQKKLDALRQ